MPSRAWILLVLAALLLAAPASAACNATTCSPACTATNLNRNVLSPFPDTSATDKDWQHVSGSSKHCGRDCSAVDLNFDLAGLTDLDYLMPVLAVADGTVSWLNLPGTEEYGNNILLNHANQFHSLYAHMDPLLMVALGQQVKAGQVIGFVSNTSTSTIADHLHFALRNSNNTASGYAQLDGTSIGTAPTACIALSSSTNQLFIEEFEIADVPGNPAWSESLSKQGGMAVLPAGDYESLFQHALHVRSGKGAYLAEYAVQLDPKVNTGLFALQLRGFNLGVHPGRHDGPPGETVRTLQGIRWTWDPTSDTHQGWEAYSDVFQYADFPLNTRFIQPALQTWGGFGGGRLDWVRFQENPPSTLGGDIRLNAYNRGGVTQLVWSVSVPAGITSFQVLRATSKTGTYTQVGTVAANGNWLYTFKDSAITWGTQYFYKLAVLPGTQPRTVGPIGPVDTAVLANIPGLGWSKVYSDMDDIPDWAGYPGASFDGDGNTYGLINYNPNTVHLIVVPETPRSLRFIEAYFGGNTNTWRGEVIEQGTNLRISIGQASNTSLQTTQLTVNRFVRQIDLWFTRTNGDQFFHNAELRFVQ